MSPTGTNKKNPTRYIHYQRKPYWVRVMAILLCARYFGNGEPNWALVSTKLLLFITVVNQLYRLDPPLYIGSGGYDYLRRWWKNFLERGSIADAPRSGRPHKINHEDACRAAAIVKAGKLVLEKQGGVLVIHRVHYTSIAEAVRQDAELQLIVNKLHVNHEQLLHAMHMADPGLVRRKIFFKHLFTPKQLAARQQFAGDCLRDWLFWPKPLGFLSWTTSFSLMSPHWLSTSSQSLMCLCGVTTPMCTSETCAPGSCGRVPALLFASLWLSPRTPPLQVQVDWCMWS
jgi:hypothetical protein